MTAVSVNGCLVSEGRMWNRIGREYYVPAPSGAIFRFGTLEDMRTKACERTMWKPSL